jgi:hypothetical protein
MLAPTLVPALERALRDLRYGYIQLVVHDGQLVRIERVERIRLTEASGSHLTEHGHPTPSEEERPGERDP